MIFAAKEKLEIVNARGFAARFSHPPDPSRAKRGEDRIPFELFLIIHYKDGEYWIWYAGMSGELRVSFGLAKSKDGVAWEKKGEVMVLDVEREGRNEVGITEDHVIWNGSEFEMFYAVLQDEGQVLNPIWHAVSKNGINWIKDNDPILRKGNENSWTGQGIASPSVLLENGKYRMWYVGTRTDGKTFFKGGIGLAEKKD